MELFFKGKKTRKIVSDSNVGDKSYNPADIINIINSNRDWNIVDIPPHIIAIHLTVIDINLFKKIMAEELLSCGWISKKKELLTPNIVCMMRQFNNICYFIIGEILKYSTAKLRCECIRHLIKTAKKLLYLNNINSMKAVITALQSTSIYRLNDSWELLPKSDKELFQKYEILLSEDNNREKLRAHINISKLPCIPYLGIYLTDLTYIDTIFPSHGGLDITRRRKMGNIIKFISEFKQSTYEFVDIVDQLVAFFSKERYIDEFKKFIDDRYYEASVKLEPLLKNDNKSKNKKTHSRALCKSDNAKFIISKNQNNNFMYTSLVDGSPMISNRATMKNRLIPCSPLYLRPKCADIVSSTNHVMIEGSLKRSVVIKKGKKSQYSKTKRVWVTLTLDNHLTHFPISNSIFSCITSNSFKHPFHKIIDASQCYISVAQDKQKSFHLVDPLKDIVYKYKAKTNVEGEEWFKYISAVTKKIECMPLNLISFDETQESDHDGTNGHVFT